MEHLAAHLALLVLVSLRGAAAGSPNLRGAMENFKIPDLKQHVQAFQGAAESAGAADVIEAIRGTAEPAKEKASEVVEGAGVSGVATTAGVIGEISTGVAKGEQKVHDGVRSALGNGPDISSSSLENIAVGEFADGFKAQVRDAVNDGFKGTNADSFPGPVQDVTLGQMVDKIPAPQKINELRFSGPIVADNNTGIVEEGLPSATQALHGAGDGEADPKAEMLTRKVLESTEEVESLLFLVPALILVAIIVLVIFVVKPVVFLKRDEQLLVEKLSDKEVRNGPGMCICIPVISKATRRKALLLEELDFVVVTDTLSGVQRVECGPQLTFIGAYELVGQKTQKHVLEKDEYIKVRNSKDGEVRVVFGPSVFVPEPTESTPDGKRRGVSLKKHEYVRITDSATGVVRIERGEQLVFPGPMEVMEAKQSAWKLRRNEYIKLIDTATGEIRVEIGEKIVFPTPTEDTRAVGQFAKVCEAVDINEETAVLVQSKETGQQRLIQEKGTFFPEAHDEVLEVRKLIRVEPHEVAIVQDNTGLYTFHGGSAAGLGTAFFLPPHAELVTMYWGSAASPDEVANNQLARGTKTVNFKVPVTKIDTRSQYAFFEYNVRTSDNVELVLEGTIFWQVVDVPKMIKTTGDPKGDVWFHARSAMIQAVSRVNLEVFMAEFNEIVNKASEADDTFYSERGVKMHALEVTRYACADGRTSQVLQEIIQETTNRINRMQKQQSDNEVQREKVSGEIEVEKQKTDLVQARCDNDRMRAIIEGEADGLRLAKSASTFFSVLSETLPDEEARLQLYRFFEEQRQSTKRTEHISSGNANLILTPQDVHLKVHA